jgi:hypothetical protein
MKSILFFAPQTSTNNYRLISYVFLATILIFGPVNSASGQVSAGKTFIVAPGGSDTNPGTKLQPLATLEAARNAARMSKSGNDRIIVMPGEYYLTTPLELDLQDNGLTIEADTNGPVILYGGTQVTGWRRDGEKFWCTDLPGVKEGTLDFRSLVVNGRMPERARIPETGTFLNQNLFNVPWLSSIGGGWARKPTQEELITLLYDPKDVPETLDTKNAEVRVYHSWDESLVGVAKNDIRQHALIFTRPASYPPGSFGQKDYIIYNTREGMTKQGRWYLDRSTGRLVYWPRDGEDMSTTKVIAPRIERIIGITGEQDKKAENITIRGLKLQATTTPFKSAGMGAISFNGAITMINIRNCKIEGLEISNAGGVGISATQMANCYITDCHVYNIGGAGGRIDGNDIFFARNHIHNVGIYYPGAVGISSNGNKNHIYHNEIHDVPYSGMMIGKNEIIVEENLIYRVMREIHDGGAIYAFGVSNCVYRGNVIRDIRTVGTGTAAFGYYLDEGSHDCIVEKNVAIGVERPTHNHIVRNSIIRDNVFINEEDMILSFQSSANMTFEGNTLITPGKIRITAPNGVTSWKNNKIFSNGRDQNNVPQTYTIDTVMPYVPVPAHKTRPVVITRSTKAPKLDGDLSPDEWPGDFQRLDRLPSRWSYSGAPVLVKLSWDDKYLYIGAMITMFDAAKISQGDNWGKDDGIEISIGGFDNSKPAVFIIHSFVDGTVKSITDAGVTATAAQRLGKGLQYISKIMEKPRKGWIGEWAIPLNAMGIKPTTDLKVPFNICAYVNEYDKWHCWEGTLGENWEVDKAGVLQFK